MYYTVYPWDPTQTSVNITFYFGNTEELIKLFSNEQLKYIEKLKDVIPLGGLENTFYYLFHDNKNAIKLDVALEDFYTNWNMISSLNISDIFYDEKNHSCGCYCREKHEIHLKCFPCCESDG
jgi:Cu/Ag efflux pump CusA